MIGLSLRLALTLGLHLRNEDSALGEPGKEALIHTWWSLHSIECLLSSVTGRPPAIAFEYCTVPLPRILPGVSQNSSGTSRRASYRRTGDESRQAGGSSNNLCCPSPALAVLYTTHKYLLHVQVVSQQYSANKPSNVPP